MVDLPRAWPAAGSKIVLRFNSPVRITLITKRYWVLIFRNFPGVRRFHSHQNPPYNLFPIAITGEAAQTTSTVKGQNQLQITGNYRDSIPGMRKNSCRRKNGGTPVQWMWQIKKIYMNPSPKGWGKRAERSEVLTGGLSDRMPQPNG